MTLEEKIDEINIESSFAVTELRVQQLRGVNSEQLLEHAIRILRVIRELSTV